MTYDDLYADMLAELETIRRNQPDRLKRIEASFLVAWRYRNKLPLKDPLTLTTPQLDPLQTSQLPDNQLPKSVLIDPIAYFKTHLPRFEAELKFCELTYYALKFSPTEPLHERQDFLLRELGRRNRTIVESQTMIFPAISDPSFPATLDLYTYIQSGRTDLDESLFASDPDLAATYATAIATFIALDRYHAYLQLAFSDLIKS